VTVQCVAVHHLHTPERVIDQVVRVHLRTLWESSVEQRIVSYTLCYQRGQICDC